MYAGEAVHSLVYAALAWESQFRAKKIGYLTHLQVSEMAGLKEFYLG